MTGKTQWRRVARAMTALLLCGWAAETARGDVKQEIQKLRARLARIRQRLNVIRGDLARDAAIHNKRKVLQDAGAAALEARKGSDDAREALQAAEGGQRQAMRRLLEADPLAKDLLAKARELEAGAKDVQTRLDARRKALEADEELVAAKKAWQQAQAQAAVARAAYQKALREKPLADPQAKELTRQWQERWAEYRQVRAKVDRIKTLLHMGNAVLEAQRALDAAIRKDEELYLAKQAEPDGGEAMKTVQTLSPKIGVARRDLGVVQGKIDATDEVKAAKAEWDRARPAVAAAQKAHERIRDEKIAADNDGAALLLEWKTADAPARRKLAPKLNALRAKVAKDPEVLDALEGSRVAAKHEADKRDAYYKTRADALAADPKGAELLATIKDLQAKLTPAGRKLGGYRAAAAKAPEVLAARKDIQTRRAELQKLRAAYEQALLEKIAAYPEAKKLLEEQTELEAKLKELSAD